MKKKYFILIGIFLMLLIMGISVIILKKKKSIDEKSYTYEEKIKEMEQEKEELIRLCEENQEELKAMSKEYLVLMEELGKSKEELTYEDLKDMNKQVKSKEWERMDELLKLYAYIPDYAVDCEGIVYYDYWNNWGRELDLIYIDADGDKVIEYMEMYGGFMGEIIKVNEHLYVHFRTFPWV